MEASDLHSKEVITGVETYQDRCCNGSRLAPSKLRQLFLWSQGHSSSTEGLILINLKGQLCDRQ
ncbi:hypothetical protein EJB05_27773, partial [Eragrostis curvula]